MKTIFAVVAVLLLVFAAKAAPLKDQQFLNLWSGAAPGAQGDTPADIPAVQIFLPAGGKASGASFVICPGGGYAHLAPHEGATIGEWMAKQGITAFVLRYRLGPKYHH